jgi:thiol-disulfide isomerase/thioredoxin
MKKGLNSRIASLCLTALLSSTAISADTRKASKPVSARSFTLPDTKGIAHNLSQWKGKVVVLNFWATWCPPCLKEIPEFIKLQKELGGKGLQFIGIAIDDAQEVEDFIEMHEVNYPVLVGEENASEIAFMYGNHLGVLPFSVVINRKGEVVSRHKGELQPQKLKEILLPLL